MKIFPNLTMRFKGFSMLCHNMTLRYHTLKAEIPKNEQVQTSIATVLKFLLWKKYFTCIKSINNLDYFM